MAQRTPRRGHSDGIRARALWDQEGTAQKGTPWYAAIQAEALRKVEAEWQAKQAAAGSK